MALAEVSTQVTRFAIKQPFNLSPRIKWLRDYFFMGVNRTWKNDWSAWTTGTPWDVQYNEALYYIVPEAFMLLTTIKGSFRAKAQKHQA